MVTEGVARETRERTRKIEKELLALFGGGSCTVSSGVARETRERTRKIERGNFWRCLACLAGVLRRVRGVARDTRERTRKIEKGKLLALFGVFGGRPGVWFTSLAPIPDTFRDRVCPYREWGFYRRA